jgi:hypothetical protein
MQDLWPHEPRLVAYGVINNQAIVVLTIDTQKSEILSDIVYATSL